MEEGAQVPPLLKSYSVERFGDFFVAKILNSVHFRHFMNHGNFEKHTHIEQVKQTNEKRDCQRWLSPFEKQGSSTSTRKYSKVNSRNTKHFGVSSLYSAKEKPLFVTFSSAQKFSKNAFCDRPSWKCFENSFHAVENDFTSKLWVFFSKFGTQRRIEILTSSVYQMTIILPKGQFRTSVNKLHDPDNQPHKVVFSKYVVDLGVGNTADRLVGSICDVVGYSALREGINGVYMGRKPQMFVLCNFGTTLTSSSQRPARNWEHWRKDSCCSLN